jgi:carboxyl-terminal processing protease
MRSRTLVLSGFIVFLLCAALPAQQATQPPPQISSLERDRALQMLNTIAGDIRKHYYDPKFHGVDWDARVQQAKERIQTSPTQNAALSHIAGALDALNDSHTFFLPPSRPFLHDYGLQFEAVGDHCYVIRVRPGSDAEAKGVKPGDELLAINGFVPARDNMWQVDYVFHTLRPVLSLRLDLRTPDGKTRQVDPAARYHELQKQKDLGGDGIWDMFRQMEDAARESRLRSVDVGHDLMVLKFRQFAFSQSEIDDLMGKVRKHSALVIDLRENGGGAVETLKYMVEGLFPTEVKVPTRVGRKDSKPMFEKYHPHNPWSGKLVVLVDSRSASASEILARLVQLEKRGVVIGDRSAGAVMESIQYSYQAGMGVTVFYGASITDADIIMSDGKSLEHVGVMPDQLMLATATDMASGRDPVLARAVELAGSKVTPEDAAKFFPYEWPKDKW